jgi:hypothetical protein
MSMVAEVFVLDAATLPALREAVGGKRGLFRRKSSTFDEVLAAESRERLGYEWQGYVLATLLAFLDERGIALMESPDNAPLSEGAGGTCIVLSPELRDRYADRLDPSGFDPGELRAYYEGFNETEGEEWGDAMLDGIRLFRDALTRLDDGKVALLRIA